MDTAFSVHRLRVFRAVAERRSFTLAAADLSTAQPAVSRVIQLLEAATGTPLFNRQPGAVVLTEAGEKVYQYAVRVVAATSELERSLARLSGPVSERLALGAGPILAVYLLPPLVGRFREAHPGVETSLLVGYANELVPRLIANEIDLLLLGQSPDPEFASSIVAEMCFLDELHVVVGNGHPLARPGSISLDTLRGVPFVLPRPGSWLRGVVDRHLSHVGIRPTIALEIEETEGIKRAVQANVGAAYLSAAAIKQERVDGTLHVVHVDGPPLVRPVYLMHSARRRLPTIARQFVALLSAGEQRSHR
jgi:DNA-binding transcriptional LysR family regulator